MGEVRYTEQQLDLVEKVFALDKGKTIVCSAVAGSGKTTTIEGSIRRFQERMRVGLYVLAFNKDIAQHIQSRLPEVICKTFHSFAMVIMAKSNERFQLSKERNDTLLEKSIGTISNVYLRPCVAKLVSLMYNKGWGLNGSTHFNLEDTESLYRDSSIEPPERGTREQVAFYAYSIFKNIVDIGEEKFSFDHLLWYATKLLSEGKVKFDQASIIFVDEYQDLNMLQLKMLYYIQKSSKCRLVFLGDPNQAIYGFRGAGTTTYTDILTLFDVEHSLSLTYNFRCGTKIISMAQEYVPEITSPEGWYDGRILRDSEVPFDVIENAMKNEQSVFIISPTNAPLVTMVEQFMLDNVPFKITNVDFFKQVMKLIRQIATKIDGSDRISLIKEFRARAALRLKEITKAYAGNRNMIKAQRDLINSAINMFDIGVRKYVKEVTMHEMDILPSKIEAMLFKDAENPQAITLSTIHKAKGLEADIVILYDWLRIIEPPASLVLEWELAQHRNSIYVALTRAKSTLVIVELAGDVE